MLVVLVWADPATAAPAVSLTTDAAPAGSTAEVVTGRSSRVTLTATNTAALAPANVGYNLAIRVVLPTGVTYTAGSARLGSGSGQAITPTSLSNTPSAGKTTLVFDNVTDLAGQSSQVIVYDITHATGTYPAGTSYVNTAQAYLTTAAGTLAQFNTSTGAVTGGATVTSAVATETTTITAVEITKTGGAADGSLLRGAHEQQTVFTLTASNNGLNATTSFTVDDYLPAGIEFLGCGDADNSTGAEYPGAGALSGHTGAPANCSTPAIVETLNNPAGYPGGVYTHIRWSIGTLAAGSTTTIRYVAAVPLRQNTMTWPGGTPLLTGAQTANLNNNGGAETYDEQPLTSYARGAGTYLGNAVSATTSLANTAEDLTIQKSGSSTALIQGAVTTWTLALRASEYRDATGAVVTDTLPDGYCPLGSANFEATAPGDQLTECDPTGAEPQVDGIDRPYGGMFLPVENADGSWTLTFNVDVPHSGTTTITIPTRTRTRYQDSGLAAAPLLVGDSLTNTATVSAPRTALCDDVARTPVGGGCPPGSSPIPGDGGSPTTSTDSAVASQTSGTIALDAQVSAAAGLEPASCGGTTSYSDTAPTVGPGDIVCWKLTVPFSTDLDTNVVSMTDYLPGDVAYDGLQTPGPANQNITVQSFDASGAPSTGGGILTWQLVPANTTVAAGTGASQRIFEVLIRTKVLKTTADAAGEIVPNLARLDYVDTAGRTTTLRDQATFTRKDARLTLVASSRSVTPVDNTLTDPRNVTVSDVVEFSVKATNSGTLDASATEVWNTLPSAYTCDDVTVISDSGSCPTGTSRITWTGVAVAAGATKELTFRVTVPTSGALRTFTDTAGVVSYTSATNDPDPGEGAFTYYPSSNIDTTKASVANAAASNDTAVIRTRSPSLGQSVATSVNETGNSSTTQATIGERLTYTVTITVPKGETMYGPAQLNDTVSNRLTVDGASLTLTRNGTPVTFGATTSDYRNTSSGAALQILFPTDHPVSSSADEVYVMQFSATVDDESQNVRGGTVTNSANMKAAATSGGGLATFSSSTSSISFVEPELSVTKSHTPSGAVHGGQNITYTVTAANAASRAIAHEAVITDTLPAGLTPVTPIANGGSWDAATRTITWPAVDIASAASAGRSYVATVGAPVGSGTDLDNTVVVGTTSLAGTSALERSSSSSANTGYRATATDRVTAAVITPTSAPDDTTPTIGQLVTYTVDMSLSDSVTYYDVTLRDSLPDGLQYVSTDSLSCVSGCPAGDGAPPSLGSITTYAPPPNGGGQTALAWFINDIAAVPRDRQFRLTFTARVLQQYQSTAAVGAGDVLTNRVSAGQNTSDLIAAPPGSAPGTSVDSTQTTANATVVEPSLIISKQVAITPAGGAEGALTDGPATTVIGDRYRYVVTIQNTGTATAYGAQVMDAPDADLETFAAGSSSSGVSVLDLDPTDGTLSWSVDQLAAGQTKTIEYTAALKPAASGITPASTVVNTADITQYDNVASYNAGTDRRYTTVAADTVTLNVNAPQLTIAKTPDNGGIVAGNDAEYEILISNTGDAPATGVVVTDTLASGQSYRATAAPATASPATGFGETSVTHGGVGPAVMTWTTGTIAPNGSVTITVPVRVDPGLATGTTLTNTASVVSTELPDPPGATPPPTDSGTLAVGIEADVSVQKAFQSAPAVAGENVTFTLTAANAGPSTATNVVVHDTLPSYLTYVSGPAGCSAAGQVVTCNAGTVTPSSTKDFAVTARVAPSRTAALSNTATITTGSPDSATGDNSAVATKAVTVDAQLAVTKTAPPSVIQSHTFNYTVAVASTGSSDAVSATLSDPLPAETSFVAVSSNVGTCAPPASPGSPVTCDFGTLPPGSGATVTITVRADAAGATVNTATANTPSAPGQDFSDPAPVAIAPGADLSAQKTAASPTVDAGGTVGFTLTAHNAGPSAADDVVLTDQLPSGTEVASAPGCTTTGRTVTCPVGAIASGAQATREITLRFPHALGGQQPANTAAVSAATADPDPSNNGATAAVTVGQSADVGIGKESSAATAGSTVQWTLTVRNAGPNRAVNTQVIDPLPAGTTLLSATPSRGSCSGEQTVTCDLGELMLGATAQIVIVARVDRGLVDTVVRNSASVASDTPDGDPGNNAASAAATAEPLAGGRPILAIEKHALAEAVAIGDPITYEVKVSNTGFSSATSVNVLDTMDQAVVVASATTDGGQCSISGSTIRCSMAPIEPLGSGTIRVVVYPTRPGTLTNSASVSSPDQPALIETPFAAAAAAVATGSPAPVTIKKTTDTRSVEPGKRVQFTIRVKNRSATTAVGLRVCDPLPPGLTYYWMSAGATLTGGKACWTIPYLKSGEKRTFRLVARATGGNRPQTVKNTASASGPNTPAVSSSAKVQVQPSLARGGGVTG